MTKPLCLFEEPFLLVKRCGIVKCTSVAVGLALESIPLTPCLLDTLARGDGVTVNTQHVEIFCAVSICREKGSKYGCTTCYKGTSGPPDVKPVWSRFLCGISFSYALRPKQSNG
jgi:hypothetical protein